MPATETLQGKKEREKVKKANCRFLSSILSVSSQSPLFGRSVDCWGPLPPSSVPCGRSGDRAPLTDVNFFNELSVAICHRDFESYLKAFSARHLDFPQAQIYPDTLCKTLARRVCSAHMQGLFRGRTKPLLLR